MRPSCSLIWWILLTLAGNVRRPEFVDLLNTLFSAFETLVKQLKLEKIKTIGDAYMVAGGIPEEHS